MRRRGGKADRGKRQLFCDLKSMMLGNLPDPAHLFVLLQVHGTQSRSKSLAPPHLHVRVTSHVQRRLYPKMVYNLPLMR